ncbi:MAG: transposase [Phormidesmis sp. CAN_BIN44]|nr:transposase [Phormidesmis sp. CAN_BIN44]
MIEGINNWIKLIKRQGYAFSNFDDFRAHLLACFSNRPPARMLERPHPPSPSLGLGEGEPVS